jgi:pimeloyl-ACP methyl ester carboxylesterase
MPLVRLNDTQLFYTTQGSGSPLLLIHGTGMNADMWGSVVSTLAARYQVITYDRRGHSRSPGSPSTDYQRHADDAAALLHLLAIPVVTVIGWSAGGIIAIDLAVRYPQCVGSLLLDEPPLHAKTHPDLGLIRILLKVQLQRRLVGAPRAATTFLRYALSSVAGGSAFDRWPAAWRAAMVQNAKAVLAELDAGTGEHLGESVLAQIACPITCIRGTESPPFLIRATERLRQIFPHAGYQVVSHAGHGLHIDRPAAFLEAVEHTVKQHLGLTNVPKQK